MNYILKSSIILKNHYYSIVHIKSIMISKTYIPQHCLLWRSRCNDTLVIVNIFGLQTFVFQHTHPHGKIPVSFGEQLTPGLEQGKCNINLDRLLCLKGRKHSNIMVPCLKSAETSVKGPKDHYLGQFEKEKIMMG